MREGTLAADNRPHRERPADRMPCLDGLRGLAALMVVLGHAADFGLPTIIAGHSRECGVLVFFALSGFLMGDLYLVSPATRSRMAAYGVARFARIVPIYYLIVITSFLIYIVHPAFVYAVTPVQLLRLLTFNGSVSVFWSIGPEVQFYAVFVAVWTLRDRLRQDTLFSLIVIFFSTFTLSSIRYWPGVFVLSKFHIFAGGMLMALLRHHYADRLRSVIPVMHGIGFVIVAVFLIPGLSEALFGPTPFDRNIDPSFTNFYGSLPRVILAAGLTYAFSFSSRIGSAVLANPLAARLGQCSFSIYLLHVPVYQAVTRSGAATLVPGGFATGLVALATCLIALLSHRLIEAPARDRLRESLGRLIPRSVSGLHLKHDPT